MLSEFLVGSAASACNITIHALVMAVVIRVSRVVSGKTVVIACMLGSSKLWGALTAPTFAELTCRWRSHPQHQQATFLPGSNADRQCR